MLMITSVIGKVSCSSLVEEVGSWGKNGKCRDVGERLQGTVYWEGYCVEGREEAFWKYKRTKILVMDPASKSG